MTKYVTIPFIIILFLCILTGCSQSTKLHTFTSDVGKFSILMPLEPKKQSQSTDTPSGTIEGTLYLAEVENAAYMVGYLDLPKALVEANTTKYFLDDRRDNVLKNANGQLKRERDITIDGYLGREFIADAVGKENRQGVVKTKILLVDNRLYQATVLAFQGQLSEEEMDIFLNSFKLLD